MQPKLQNKLAKQAYFIKRLRDSGYHVERLFAAYSKSDPRMWTIIINPKGASLMCTCYINNGEAEDISPNSKCYFEIFDGGQFIPGRFAIDTNSIEVLITNLIKFGIEPVNENTKVSVKR